MNTYTYEINQAYRSTCYAFILKNGVEILRIQGSNKAVLISWAKAEIKALKAADARK